ncbi:MAG: pyridoxal 5'-phosphate synthase glutaminase subunit PdxT [Bdellovibrionales bacterium]|nr:pyridoxal 5'-phosphate synthase glutaminase subunit PdxT [Bdellovibrionales bacterium]
MSIGVLGLQGDYEAHRQMLAACDVRSLLVRKREELESVSGLIIPGGESTTLLKLLGPDFCHAIVRFVEQGRPLFTTCAGTILVARNVMNPQQESLGLLDITVERNAYGRQIDSFIAQNLSSEAENSNLGTLDEAIFIRAPRIVETGPSIKVLYRHKGDPVLVQHDRILAATFHPELSTDNTQIHRYFISLTGECP